MKKIILITLLALAPVICAAQSLDYDGLFKKYAGRDGYTTMDFSGTMLKLLSGSDSFSGVNSLKLIVAEQAEKVFEKDALGTISHEGFNKLFDVNSGGDFLQIWHKEKGKGSGKSKNRSEYILIAGSDETLTAMYVEGYIDLANLTDLSRISFGN